tara:strand:+ start:158 stop:613 length:456 start_codon:yes stop_codon:yes gene_type:complete
MKRFRDTNYYISIDGRVYSNGREKGWKASFKRNNGYISYGLYIGGKVKQFLAHRLVIEAYTEPSSLSVDHIDGNRENNNLSNLEYVTSVENSRRSKKVTYASRDLPNYITYNKYRNNYRYSRSGKILKTSKLLSVVEDFKNNYENNCQKVW